MLCELFPFGREIPINYLFTRGNEHIDWILDLARRSVLNMGFVDKQPSRMQRHFYFLKWAGASWSFWLG